MTESAGGGIRSINLLKAVYLMDRFLKISGANSRPHSVHPPPPPSFAVRTGRGGASNQIFKKVGLDRTSTIRGGGDFFQAGGRCNFHIKNILKSEIFNDKKSL